MKSYRLYLLCVVIIINVNSFVNGQTTIPCEILELAKLTLQINPVVKKGVYDINRAEAGVQVQQSEFDYNIVTEIDYQNINKNMFPNDALNSNIDGDYFETRNAEYSVGLQKKFRTGLNANISVGYSLDQNNYTLNSFSEEVGPFVGENASRATLSITQPLMKGRGKKATTALEKAIMKNVENTQKDYSFSVAYEIYQLSSAYWQYLNSYKCLDIYKENERRVRVILEVTEELVNADKKPKGDLVQIYAELADQERQTEVAEQSLFRARINLGEVIGLNRENSKKLNIPLNNFPGISGSGFQEGLSEEIYVRLAKNNRDDLKAMVKSIESLELQMYSARKNLQPQLDLTGTLIFRGQSLGNGLDNSFSAFSSHEGRSTGGRVGLSLRLPVNNNAARGSFTQIESSLTAQKILIENLERNISLNVRLALSNLNNSVIVLNKAEESLSHYREAFNNEQVKFQNGLTTLLNLLIFQARLTNAELVHLQSCQQFANAIVKLRFETGTLIKQDVNKAFFVDNESFYTIPTINNY